MVRDTICKLLFALMIVACQPVYAQDGEHVTVRLNEFDGLSHHHATSILQDASGMIWIGTWNGLNRYDGYEFVTFKSHSGDGSNVSVDRISDMRLLKGDRILCDVEEKAYIFKIADGTFHDLHMGWKEAARKFGADVSDGQRHIQGKNNISWEVDKLGVLMGYTKDPVAKMVPQVSATQTRCLFRDKNGIIWVSTKEDKTLRLYDSRLKLLGYMDKNGNIHSGYTPFGASVYTIFQDREGVMWLGSKPEGLFRLNASGRGYKVEHLSKAPCKEVYDIKEDRWGRLWIASMDKGVFCIANPHDKECVLRHEPLMVNGHADASRSIRYLHFTSDDKLLIATTKGLFITSVTASAPSSLTCQRHLREADREQSLSNSATMYILQGNNRMFVSTEGGGINMFPLRDILARSLSFKHFDNVFESTGYISSMFDYKGLVWCVGTHEIIAMNPDDGSYVLYNNDIWDDKLLFSDAVPLDLGGGRWWFGLVDGSVVLDLDKLMMQRYVPPIVLTGVTIEDGREEHAVSRSDTIMLGAHERNVRVSFAALDYINSDNVCYRFKLDDSGWNDLEKNHTVTLLELSPGSHRLCLQSKSANGTWTKNTRCITIIVKPTVWETTAAKIVYVLLTLALLAAIFYTYNYIVRIRRERQETLRAYLDLLNARKEKPAGGQPLVRKPVETASTKLSEEDEAMMRRVVDYVDANLEKSEISINDLADAAGMSVSSLNRKMKDLLGSTPKEFLRKARMDRACYLLLNTEQPIKEIAYACGFSDQNYFGKKFRSQYGVSPTDYRLNKG